jgi:diaminopimelate epimerase
MSGDVKKISFVKMTGAGNDFVLIDDRTTACALNWVKLAPILCDRRFGVGADGLLVLELSKSASVKMLYYNADGSYGGMCGNGGRCVAFYLMQKEQIDRTTIEALGFIYNARTSGEKICLHMKDPKGLRQNIILDTSSGRLVFHYVDTGAPHAVTFVDEMPASVQRLIEASGIGDIGRMVRFHETFAPEGTNVDFIEVAGPRQIRMRTYERGVEGETLACGTGSVASAIIANSIKKLDSPIDVITSSHNILTVSFSAFDGVFRDVVLTGPAAIVYTGTVCLDPSGLVIASIYRA